MTMGIILRWDCTLGVVGAVDITGPGVTMAGITEGAAAIMVAAGVAVAATGVVAGIVSKLPNPDLIKPRTSAKPLCNESF